MLRAIVVDDEPETLYAITKQIEENCPEVTILASCNSEQKDLKLF